MLGQEGFAIPAHVDQASGLFTVCTGNTLEQVLDNKCVFAMEVTDLAKAKPQLYIGKNLNWAEVLELIPIIRPVPEINAIRVAISLG